MFIKKTPKFQLNRMLQIKLRDTFVKKKIQNNFQNNYKTNKLSQKHNNRKKFQFNDNKHIIKMQFHNS